MYHLKFYVKKSYYFHFNLYENFHYLILLAFFLGVRFLDVLKIFGFQAHFE